jgi:glucose-1-phosphate thymidylyltransferase
MKAIIPVAGKGTTLRPHTHTHPKPLIPVAGKPILGHIIETLMAAGVHDFVFVLGYLGDKIRDYVEEQARLYPDRFRYQFVTQNPRLGLAHAIALCRGTLTDDEPALIHLGDTILETDFVRVLATPGNVLGVQVVENPWDFGVAVLNDDGRIVQVVEKPVIPKSNQAIVGLYRIEHMGTVFEACDELIRRDQRTQGEFHLADALQLMLENGHVLHPHPIEGWHNCGQKDNLLNTNRLLLNKQPAHAPRQYPDSIIVPPVYIPASVEITHSVVGPYVAVGEHARIERSVVQDSILGSYSSLSAMMLQHSVVGNDTRLVGRWHSVNIGENTEIDFNE